MAGIAGEVTRRRLIQRALLALGTAPAGLIGCVSRRVMGGAALPVDGALHAASKTSVLSGDEMEDLVAFGEALVEGRTLAPAERSCLVEHIERRTTRSADYLSAYRTAVSVLERLAGRPFARLEIRERIELIATHRLAASAVVMGEEDLGPLPENVRIVRARVAKDLIGAYYASPAGWAVVGYRTFPGRCGDLTRYTRAES